MPRAARNPLAISAAQLRRLHTLWHRCSARLHLNAEYDRALRHYYVELFSGGRATETLALLRSDAVRVIDWLEHMVRHAEARFNVAAGTAGRHGFPERRRVRPTASAWRALWACAAALGMNRQRLDAFIHKHYAGAGLHGVVDLRTMADVNRVLWGLKAMLRRGPGPARKKLPTLRRAA